MLGLIGGQLTPISEKGMSSYFEDFFSHGHSQYISGYDPRDNTYYLTGRGGADNDQYKTIGYDAARGVWKSRYTFQPDAYANQNNMLYSAKYTTPQGSDVAWKHDNSSMNTFYGSGASSHPSKIQVVSKISPSRVKIFNAISYEVIPPKLEHGPRMETSLGQTSGTITSWKKEGSYYASMPRNTSSGSYGSNTRDIYAGNWSCQTNDDITFLVTNARLDRLQT